MVGGLSGHVVMDRSVRPDRRSFSGAAHRAEGGRRSAGGGGVAAGRPRVDIAGDGPERRRLQGMAAALALDARFHGFVEAAARDAL
jgi:hypothetical protein